VSRASARLAAARNCFLSADGLLMPARKDQAPPDLKYFKRGNKTP
jgi:hypothetical protein